MLPAVDERGYSLIELLLVIAILSTLSVTGIVSYRSFQVRQQLEQTAQTLRTNLRFAQSQALAGVKNCPLGGTLFGWSMVPEVDRYRFYIVCRNPDDRTQNRSVELPEGIQLSVSPVALSNIYFQPVNRGVVFTDNNGVLLGSSARIILTNGSGSKTVEVRSSGDIL